MNKKNLTKLVKGFRSNISKHSPEILAGVGIAGMITTTVLAVKATPKALALIEEEKLNRYDEYGEDIPLTKMEVVKVAWKPYVPALITGVTSTACMIGSLSVTSRRTAALATAYKLSETALTEYKEKVVETIGEKKEKVIREKIAKDKIEKNPVSKSEVIITEKGNTLCYDAVSGRYFRSDLERIRKAVNDANERMLSEMYISLNEFYGELGLKYTSLGDELGWNMNTGLIDLDFSSQIAEDGTPCIVIDYSVAPRYNYSKLM